MKIHKKSIYDIAAYASEYQENLKHWKNYKNGYLDPTYVKYSIIMSNPLP